MKDVFAKLAENQKLLKEAIERAQKDDRSIIRMKNTDFVR
jgi:hypothetical protein